MDEQKGRERLAAQVKAERRRRYRTITAAVVASGVARGTWEKVERAQRVKSFTLDAVEASLGWPQGRAERILAGADGEPQLRKDWVEIIEASTVLDDAAKRQLIADLARTEGEEPPESEESQAAH